jgi:hypothetical protein
MAAAAKALTMDAPQTPTALGAATASTPAAPGTRMADPASTVSIMAAPWTRMAAPAAKMVRASLLGWGENESLLFPAPASFLVPEIRIPLRPEQVLMDSPGRRGRGSLPFYGLAEQCQGCQCFAVNAGVAKHPGHITDDHLLN